MDVLLTIAAEVRASQTLEIPHSEARELMFFCREVADEWKGWAGQKTWKLRDERLRLDAEHQGVGHAVLRVRLLPRYFDLDWELTANMIFELGHLTEVARFGETLVKESSLIQLA